MRLKGLTDGLDRWLAGQAAMLDAMARLAPAIQGVVAHAVQGLGPMIQTLAKARIEAAREAQQRTKDEARQSVIDKAVAAFMAQLPLSSRVGKVELHFRSSRSGTPHPMHSFIGKLEVKAGTIRISSSGEGHTVAAEGHVVREEAAEFAKLHGVHVLQEIVDEAQAARKAQQHADEQERTKIEAVARAFEEALPLADELNNRILHLPADGSTAHSYLSEFVAMLTICPGTAKVSETAEGRVATAHADVMRDAALGFARIHGTYGLHALTKQAAMVRTEAVDVRVRRGQAYALQDQMTEAKAAAFVAELPRTDESGDKVVFHLLPASSYDDTQVLPAFGNRLLDAGAAMVELPTGHRTLTVSADVVQTIAAQFGRGIDGEWTIAELAGGAAAAWGEVATHQAEVQAARDSAAQIAALQETQQREAKRVRQETAGKSAAAATPSSRSSTLRKLGRAAIDRVLDAVGLGQQSAPAVKPIAEAPPAIALSAATLPAVSMTGSSTFRLALDPRNSGAFLRRTFDYGTPNQRAAIYVDGRFAGTWYSAGGVRGRDLDGLERRWRDEEFPLPPALTAGKFAITVRVQYLPTADPPDRAWTEFSYRLYSLVVPGCTRERGIGRTLPALRHIHDRSRGFRAEMPGAR